MPVTRRKATMKRRIDESRCVDRNTDDPVGAFNAFKNDPAQAGVETADGGYKGLESRLVDEGDKKFIRRSVGAAPPRRWRREQRKTKTR